MVRWLWASFPVSRVARAGQHRESALRALVKVTPELWRRRTAGRKRSSSARMSSVRTTTMLGLVWAARLGWPPAEECTGSVADTGDTPPRARSDTAMAPTTAESQAARRRPHGCRVEPREDAASLTSRARATRRDGAA